MKRVIYISHRQASTTNEDIDDIVKVAKEINGANHIKGVLISLPEHFYQVLEGPVSAVSEVMGRIVKDHRHHSVKVFSEESISGYQFAKWTMVHYEVDEEFTDYYYLLSKFATSPNYEDNYIKGIKMMLLGLS